MISTLNGPLLIGIWMLAATIYLAFRGRLTVRGFLGRSDISRMDRPTLFWILIGLAFVLSASMIVVAMSVKR